VEAVHEVERATKGKQTKAGGRQGGESAAKETPVAGPVEDGQELAGNPATITGDTEVPDDDVMYEARCILKQRQRKGGKRQFLVKWADDAATDFWCNEHDVSDALLAHWFITHNQKGLKRKRLNLALIGMPGPWACRRWWEERSPPMVEKIDQYGNEL